MEYPNRSPLLVAEVIKPIIEGKTVCDLGCSTGDLMREFSKYASRVFGIDRSPQENPDILCGDLLEIEIPPADAYYLWIHPRDVGKVIEKIPHGIIILGDYDQAELERHSIRSEITIRFPFTERGVDGWWRLHIIKK